MNTIYWQQRLDRLAYLVADDIDATQQQIRDKLQHADELASQWSSCAVGEALDLGDMTNHDCELEIEKHPDGQELKVLGRKFMTCFDPDNPDLVAARQILDRIEAIVTSHKREVYEYL